MRNKLLKNKIKLVICIVSLLLICTIFGLFIGTHNDNVQADETPQTDFVPQIDGWSAYPIWKGGPNGIKVFQKDGVTPKVTTTYTPKSTSTDKASDPWMGGILHVKYENTVRAEFNLDFSWLFNMAAYIKLPEEVTALDVLNGKKDNPTLTINNTPIPLEGNGTNQQLVAVDASIDSETHQIINKGRFLKLTMRKTNTKNIDKTLNEIINSKTFKFDWDNIQIVFDIDIDIAKITKDGKFPAIKYAHDDPEILPNGSPLSVDFYGDDEVVEKGKYGIFGIISGIDIIYSKYEEEHESHRATGYIKGWNEEIVPKYNFADSINLEDSKVKSNDNIDVPEYLKNVKTRYTVNVSNADPEMFGENGKGVDPEIFANAVDYFSPGKEVPSNIKYNAYKLNGDNAKDNIKNIQPGETRYILYYGTNSHYPYDDLSKVPLDQRLSPAVLKVTRPLLKVPILAGGSTLKNQNTGQSGNSVTVNIGDKITRTDDFALKGQDFGINTTQQKIRFSPPTDVTYDDKKGIKIGNTVYHTSDLQDGMLTLKPDVNGSYGWTDSQGNLVKGEFLPDKEYHLYVQYDYILKKKPADKLDLPGTEFLTIIPDVDEDNKSQTITSQLATLNFAPPVLGFAHVPQSIDFGKHNIPTHETDYEGKVNDGTVVVHDTSESNDWTVSMKLTTGKDDTGNINNQLPGKLTFNNQEIPFNADAVNVYTKSNNQKGNLTIFDSTNLNFNLKILTGTTLIPGAKYQGTVNWILGSGPTK